MKTLPKKTAGWRVTTPEAAKRVASRSKGEGVKGGGSAPGGGFVSFVAIVFSMEVVTEVGESSGVERVSERVGGGSGAGGALPAEAPQREEDEADRVPDRHADCRDEPRDRMPEDVAHAASKVTEAPMPAHAGAAAALPSVSVDVQADLVRVRVVRDDVLEPPRALAADPRSASHKVRERVPVRVVGERAVARIVHQADHQQRRRRAGHHAAQHARMDPPLPAGRELDEQHEQHEHELLARRLVRIARAPLEVFLDHEADIDHEGRGAVRHGRMQAIGRDVVFGKALARLVEDVVRLEEHRAICALA